ncbi:MAG TPA: metallophosphoesterase [Terriglobales bacterium]|nr:metallophosphoesterase [Terriglobales bacterium]
MPRRAMAQAVIAQLSDTHLGEQRAAHAAENLRLAVQMINERRPDAVILTGDIGESPADWQQAKSILQQLKAPLYYIPGNHDIHTTDIDRYRSVFGNDYYRFDVRNIDFIAIDSELLGNYDHYEANPAPPLPPAIQEESLKMLRWLEQQTHQSEPNRIMVGLQHMPITRDGDFPPDPKPYWVMSEPYRSRELRLLHELGIKHMLVGHWHNGRSFDYGGITWHVGPATSWLPWGGRLGFAMHTLDRDGNVRTEFVELPDQQP